MTNAVAHDNDVMHDYIFVYGTLRKGGIRAMPALYPAAPDLGPGVIAGALFDFGAYPGLQLDAPADETNGRVRGEVYGADAKILRALDEIEMYLPDDPPASYYFRELVTVALDDGREIVCWTYTFNPRFFRAGRDNQILSGDWIAHAATKGALPPEHWPDGSDIKK